MPHHYCDAEFTSTSTRIIHCRLKKSQNCHANTCCNTLKASSSSLKGTHVSTMPQFANVMIFSYKCSHHCWWGNRVRRSPNAVQTVFSYVTITPWRYSGSTERRRQKFEGEPKQLINVPRDRPECAISEREVVWLIVLYKRMMSLCSGWKTSPCSFPSTGGNHGYIACWEFPTRCACQFSVLPFRSNSFE